MNYANIIFKIIQGALAACVFGLVAILLLGHLGYVNTVKPFVVQSGSMEPTVPTASVIFSLPSDSYQQGDIITFHPEGNTKKTVTHRVEFKLYPDGVNGEPLFMTAGDANEDVDNWEVRSEDIVGKEVLTLPYVGYLVDFAKKPQGFILLVIVPATIVIYEELKSLFLEIKKVLLKLRDRTFKGRTLEGKGTTLPNSHKIPKKVKFTPPKSWAIFPVVGAGVFMIAFSASYFTDIEESIGNLFQAGTWGPQIANYIVINEVLYDPSHEQMPGGQGGENRGEFIELYNPTDGDVSLNEWNLDADGETISLSGHNIPTKGFLIISGADKSQLEDIYGVTITNYIQTEKGKIGNGFDNADGYVKLIDGENKIVDQLSYGTDTTVFDPAIPDVTTGYSFEREPNGVDTDTASDFVARPTPQPGI